MATRRAKARTVQSIENEIDDLCRNLGERRKTNCFPLLLGGQQDIHAELVDRVFDDLTKRGNAGGSLDVIIASSGGDIDAAYNLALLFRRFGKKRLTFIIPRWAKSAATLLACAGDEILMTPVAELGPLDPQITAMNPLEQRVERFSPLHIESTLQLIRDEFSKGNDKLAEGLMQRLQFPLTLGSFKKLLEVGQDYVEKLLSSRMLKDAPDGAKKIGRELTTGYADHSWCITVEEASKIGLKAVEIEEGLLEVVWEIHRLHGEKERLVVENNERKMREKMKKLPADLREVLPSGLRDSARQRGIGGRGNRNDRPNIEGETKSVQR